MAPLSSKEKDSAHYQLNISEEKVIMISFQMTENRPFSIKKWPYVQLPNLKRLAQGARKIDSVLAFFMMQEHLRGMQILVEIIKLKIL